VRADWEREYTEYVGRCRGRLQHRRRMGLPERALHPPARPKLRRQMDLHL